MRAPRMNDRPASSIAFWLPAETIPASATTVTSVSWCAAAKAWTAGTIVVVSALFPSNAWTIKGKPLESVSSPMVICGSRRRSLENPGSQNPSPASVEGQRRHVIQDQAGRTQPRMRHARRRQPCAAAFSSSTSASSCADPRCSISREPRRDEYTICTPAVAGPNDVFTVRTYGEHPSTPRPEALRLVRKSQTS